MRLIAKPGVFVPRDSSEFLAEQAIRRMRRRPSPVLVDVATGGGTGRARRRERGAARSQPTGPTSPATRSRSPARTPAGWGCATRPSRSAICTAGCRRGLRGAVDVITLHPPYVAKRELRELPEEIRRFEPVHVLTDHSVDGLGLIGRTVAEAGGVAATRGMAADRGQPGSRPRRRGRDAARGVPRRAEHRGRRVQGDAGRRRAVASVTEVGRVRGLGRLRSARSSSRGRTPTSTRPRIDGDAVWWLELRPAEGGRNVLVRGDPWGDPADVTPKGSTSARSCTSTAVARTPSPTASSFFLNFHDQRLYRQELGGDPVAITPEPRRPRGRSGTRTWPSRRTAVDRLRPRAARRTKGCPSNELVVLLRPTARGTRSWSTTTPTSSPRPRGAPMARTRRVGPVADALDAVGRDRADDRDVDGRRAGRRGVRVATGVAGASVVVAGRRAACRLRIGRAGGTSTVSSRDGSLTNLDGA